MPAIVSPRLTPDRTGLAGQIAQATDGLGDVGEARLTRSRTGLPVTGDPHHDQAAIERMQGLPAEAPRLHATGAEVLDQHVDRAGRNQVADQLAAFLLA
jgi:hypothetical protein